MTIQTLSIAAHLLPTSLFTSITHFAKFNKKEDDPTKHFSYDLGLHVIRKSIQYLARHTVEDVQEYLRRKIPVPYWTRTESAYIPPSYCELAANYLAQQLGPIGISEVGGEHWWRWRDGDSGIQAEWIETREQYNKRRGAKTSKVLFFVHGGAFYFGSKDEHRFHVEGHAKRLEARAFLPTYRLAPQYPFPCALCDILAAYLFILEEYAPEDILVAGDSAGGNLAIGLLLVVRDRGLPLPAAAVLLSPWVDLTHSFPSVASDGLLDFIPTEGFQHKPSIAWPPPKIEGPREDATTRPAWVPPHIPLDHFIPTIESDGKVVEIRDQIQPYACNFQLAHPLVSPVLSPSLGGLCPLLIQAGGAELLCDEQIYFAHKAANPLMYPPRTEILDRYDPERAILNKYPPTNVRLEVWDNLCHVPHTLGWTLQAKHMYCNVAQFGAWAFAYARHSNTGQISKASGTSSRGASYDSFHSSTEEQTSLKSAHDVTPAPHPERRVLHPSPHPQWRSSTRGCSDHSVGSAGGDWEVFDNHMIRLRINGNTGIARSLEDASELPALHMSADDIGDPKEVPVGRWLHRQQRFERTHSEELSQMQQLRLDLEANCNIVPANENPPPTALIRRFKAENKQ